MKNKIIENIKSAILIICLVPIMIGACFLTPILYISTKIFKNNQVGEKYWKM